MTNDASWRESAVAALLHEHDASTVAECIELASDVLDDDALRELQRSFQHVVAAPGLRCDEHMPTPARRRAGAFFTPPMIADRLAELAVAPDCGGLIVDLSCGDGELLEACARHAPGSQLVGIEAELVFALAAALRLRDRDARVIWGDGLATRPQLADCVAVVGNPPYVGEKGNRQLFAQTREQHPDLERHFGPRIDLHYLFLHRALDVLAPGGSLAYLTSEYWLTATGAGALRADLSTRSTDHVFERLGAGAFPSAPGQHSLLFAATRADGDEPGDGRTWHPFAGVDRLTTGERLGDLVDDRQGFVSGADRTTSRSASELAVEPDLPIFLWHAAEVPQADRDLFRPLIRRSDCAPNVVFRTPPGDEFVLWCDGTEDESTTRRIERLLARYRPILERRREVASGSMSWTRVWWPRRTADYARPKLVVPRRAKRPRFCLDLSGAHVSSDCTFLLAPAHVDEVAWLVRIMLAANTDAAAEQLRAFGKTKGEIIEFYSAPLRDWRLPIERSDGTEVLLHDPALEQEAADVVSRLQLAREAGKRPGN